MLQSGVFFGNTYRVERQIGSGGTGAVYLAYHTRLQKYVVIKQIHCGYSGDLALRREADILKKLHHPYLPQVYDFLQYGADVYTVIDYIPGQDLETLMAQNPALPEKTLARWLRQLLEVLDYLHSQNPPIIHSDIKPGNVILTPQGNICLIDFNISLVGMQAGKVAGYTSYYAAPEQARLAQAVICGGPSRIRLDPRIDLYSLGATFYALITGAPPGLCRQAVPLRQAAAGRYTPDFLAILDKAMDFAPERRYASAKKMLAALERLKRQDKRYRTYVVLQAATWLSAAMLLTGGVYCILRGVQTANLQQYRLVYRQLTQAVENGDDELILSRAEALLQGESYRKILAQSPRDHSAILHTLGDCYYNREDYTAAAEYYRQALDVAQEDDPLRSVYFEDAAVCLAMAGDAASAREILTEAAAAGVDNQRLQLIAAAIAARENRTADCLAAVEEILQFADKALCARACLIAADAVQDQESAIQWLEQADGYARTRQTLRRLGAAYMEQSARERSSAKALAWCQKALTCYEALCAESYATTEDRINLAVVQLSAGQTEESIRTLQELLRENPNDYRIEMNLAFACDAAGDQSAAAQYGSSALRHWQQTPATDRADENSDEIQDLLALQRRLNF